MNGLGTRASVVKKLTNCIYIATTYIYNCLSESLFKYLPYMKYSYEYLERSLDFTDCSVAMVTEHTIQQHKKNNE